MGTDTSPAFVAEGYVGGVGRSEAGDVSVPFFLDEYFAAVDAELATTTCLYVSEAA
jgi:hypothetical protein